MANFRDLIKQNGGGVYSPSNKPSPSDIGAYSKDEVNDKFISSGRNQISNPDALIRSGKNSFNALSNSYEGLEGDRALITAVMGSGGIQIAGRTVGNEIHVRAASSNGEGEIGEWHRIYTTGYKPNAADVGAYSKSESDNKYLTKTAKAADADKLDGLDSGSFVRSNADDTLAAKLVTNGSDRTHGIYGTYDSNKISHVWSMGASYRLDPTGANFGNLYGLAYKHTNNPTGGNMAGGHQIVWVTNGVPQVSLGDGGVWTNGFVQAGEYINANQSIRYNSKIVVGGTNDTWLRLNANNDFTSGVVITGKVVTTAAQGSDVNALTRKDYVDSELAKKLNLAGGTVTGDLTVNGNLNVGSSKFNMNGVNMMGASDTVSRFGDATHARVLILNAKDGNASVSNGSTTYRVYHEGYKPTANDVNAIPVDKLRGTPVAAYYLTSASNAIGTKIRLPFKTNAAKMVTFSVRVYQGYKHYDIQFSGYLYTTTNQWHSPQATMNGGTATLDVKMGRDSDGTAYVWLGGGSYRAVAVFNVVGGYNTADWNTGWTIAESDDTPNVAMATTLHPPVSSGGDVMTGTLQINGLHDSGAVVADAFKASGYGIMANRAVMYVHNANASGKVAIGVGGKYGENIKLSVDNDSVESAVSMLVKGSDVNINPASNHASINMSTAANKSCTIRMREDANKHGAYIQYDGATSNAFVVGTYQDGTATVAITIPRGNADVNFEKNIGVKGGLINLASKHRIVGETNGVKMQNVANGKNAWFGARNADWFHMETDATNGFYSYDNFNIPNLTVRAGVSAVTVGASGTGTGTGQGITYNGKTAIGGSNDTWLRLNPTGQFTNGIYCGGTGVFRHDAQIQAGAWSAANKVARVHSNHYDSSWSGNGTAAYSVNNPDSNGAHWAFASYYDATNIRSGIQILSDVSGRMRFYTNRRSRYVEVNNGEVYAQGTRIAKTYSGTAAPTTQGIDGDVYIQY
ncbi:hypothetical protein NV104_002651 [Vibrio parahaemolyticus]|nr:hypothetical protein [Vibrio parahaemolyticus]EJS9799269.1 hypothetical protein [Vibrio parahaemolyticus]